MNRPLSDQSFWDKYWNEEQRQGDPTDFIFNDLLKRYLPRGGSYFEVGCAPGTVMINFHRTFQYTVAGVDFSHVESTRNTLASHGIEAAVIDADFTTMPIDRQFDVVASWGFVEHFSNAGDIIKKQAQFVKPGGFLVVEVPNLTYFNGLIYRIFDKPLLDKHNRAIMHPAALSGPIPADEFDIVFCNFYSTNFLFFNFNNPAVASMRALKAFVRSAKFLFKLLRLDNIPNRFFSPYLILIAQRTLAAGDEPSEPGQG